MTFEAKIIHGHHYDLLGNMHEHEAVRVTWEDGLVVYTAPSRPGSWRLMLADAPVWEAYVAQLRESHLIYLDRLDEAI